MDDMNRKLDNYEPEENIVTPGESDTPVSDVYTGYEGDGPEVEIREADCPDETTEAVPVEEVTGSGIEPDADRYEDTREIEENVYADHIDAGVHPVTSDEPVMAGNQPETVAEPARADNQPETDTETVRAGSQPEERINYSAGRRYTYDPNGSEDETSYFDTSSAGGAMYGQYRASSGNSAYNGTGTGGNHTSYDGSSSQAGPNNSYGQGSGYGRGTNYGQSGNYNQGTGYGQNGSYNQSTGYGQNGSNNQGAGYGQNGNYNQGTGYGQNGSYSQGAGYGRNGSYDQGTAYGQNGNYNQGTGYSRNGNYNQGAGYGQSGDSAQGTGYGQNRHSGQNGNYSQNSTGTGNDNRYTNNGYGKGRTGYSSSYDSYRFETPVDPAPINPGETQYGKKKKKADKTDSKSKGTPKKIGMIAGIAVLFGLVAALVFMGVTSLAGKKVSNASESRGGDIIAAPTPSIALGGAEKAQDPSSASTGTSDTNIETVELTVPQVVEQCMPSMVAITNTTIEEYYDFFGGRSQQESVSAGSGIIVGETETELLIATNNHVVQNSTDITVTFIDNAAITGSIKGMDADNDLAIIAVKLDDVSQETKDAIRIITIGNSDEMVVGESVVAIGNALGYGQSVSAGIISALGREVDIDGQKHSLIQTDASINPGNSGGALINMRGELIGINEVKFVDETVEGVGYAIPMATAEPILSSLGSKAARQKVSDDEASYIGIKCLDVPSYYVQSGYPAGVYVSEVTDGGPAEKAGLKEGDIITAIDGISVTTSAQLINYLQYYAAGETIDFSVSRLNKDNTAFDSSKIPITLGSKKDAGLFEENDDKESDDSASEEEEAGENAEEKPEEGTEDRSEEGLDNGEFPFMPDVENR